MTGGRGGKLPTKPSQTSMFDVMYYLPPAIWWFFFHAIQKKQNMNDMQRLPVKVGKRGLISSSKLTVFKHDDNRLKTRAETICQS